MNNTRSINDIAKNLIFINIDKVYINTIKNGQKRDIFFINILYLSNLSLSLISLGQLVRNSIFIKFIFNDIKIDYRNLIA